MAARSPTIKPAALSARHPRRGARPVLRHAGAAEIPQERPQRSRGRARGGAPPRHEPAGRRLHARRRRARAGDLGGGAAGRGRPAGAARPTCWARISAPTPSRCAAEREGVVVEGYAGAADPHAAPTALGQYLFVNGRPVRDKLLIGVIRGAYADYLPRDRHPVVALFVTLPIRARSTSTCIRPRPRCASATTRLVRALLMHALKEALGARRPARRHDRRQRHHRGVPAGRAAPARRVRLAALAVAAAAAARRIGRVGAPTPSRALPRPRRRCSMSARPAADRARRDRRAGARSARPAARRRPRPGARHLHRGADPRRPRHRRPARRP